MEEKKKRGRNPENQGKSVTPVAQEEGGEVDTTPEAPVVQAARKSVIPQSSPPPSSFPTSTGTQVPGEVMSSFGDGDDPEVVAAEEARIMEARRRAAQAAQVAAAEEPRDPLRDAVQVESVGGVDAYRLPKEEVSPRGRKSAPKKKKGRKTKKGPESTENPHFKPSR
jgi:hypothetical protein